jgi:hypothetical protein
VKIQRTIRYTQLAWMGSGIFGGIESSVEAIHQHSEDTNYGTVETSFICEALSATKCLTEDNAVKADAADLALRYRG